MNKNMQNCIDCKDKYNIISSKYCVLCYVNQCNKLGDKKHEDCTSKSSKISQLNKYIGVISKSNIQIMTDNKILYNEHWKSIIYVIPHDENDFDINKKNNFELLNWDQYIFSLDCYKYGKSLKNDHILNNYIGNPLKINKELLNDIFAEESLHIQNLINKSPKTKKPITIYRGIDTQLDLKINDKYQHKSHILSPDKFYIAKKMEEAGFVKVYDLDGGISKWQHEGYEVEIKS